MRLVMRTGLCCICRQSLNHCIHPGGPPYVDRIVVCPDCGSFFSFSPATLQWNNWFLYVIELFAIMRMNSFYGPLFSENYVTFAACRPEIYQTGKPPWKVNNCRSDPSCLTYLSYSVHINGSVEVFFFLHTKVLHQGQWPDMLPQKPDIPAAAEIRLYARVSRKKESFS